MLRQGLGYLRELARHRVAVHWDTALVAVEQSRSGLDATLGDGSRHAVDVVTMGYGFLPSNELLRLLGCRHRFDAARGQLVTERDADCRTSVPDVLAVGDCCGTGGALAAEAEGTIAGAAASGRPAVAEVARARSALARQRRFQAGLWQLFAAPRVGLAYARADTIVCRCEEVTLASVDGAITDGAASLGAIKRATRCGMGRCQGRYCGPLLAEHLHERLGRPLDELAFFAPRPPIKPVPLSTIAAGDSMTERTTDQARAPRAGPGPRPSAASSPGCGRSRTWSATAGRWISTVPPRPCAPTPTRASTPSTWPITMAVPRRSPVGC